MYVVVVVVVVVCICCCSFVVCFTSSLYSYSCSVLVGIQIARKACPIVVRCPSLVQQSTLEIDLWLLIFCARLSSIDPSFLGTYNNLYQ